jgi:preprotein translocase subunit SecA
MFAAIAKKLFGTSNDRILRRYQQDVEAINALEPTLQGLSDEELRAKTAAFRERIGNGEALKTLLPEAFATVREAATRTLGQRHFDVQLVGGMVLFEGNIAEMKTGEGKTLVATLPAYLYALTGAGVHVVTVNDYLAARDAEWMGQIYRFLGLEVGCIVHGLDDEQRRQAYGADITYGTNNEYGFDYLRDNMKFTIDTMVQRGFNFAIVDEVDSILVDEARTPLIISGAAEDSSDLYRTVDAFIPRLAADDFEVDEKTRTATFTETGVETAEAMLQEAGLLQSESLYDVDNVLIVHHVNQALRAHKNFTRDVDYIVKDDKVIIIDEFTGRMMEGRRFSDGLHQALEAKENATIQPENQTLASITFQNYFRMYPTLSGMTGTAVTEAEEFADIYKLEVIEVPTNLPMIRIDNDDEVYRTADEKYDAILDLVKDCSERGQPILVGTTSIEKSELISELLTKRKITHNVLNARHHEQEASIIAQAGRVGAVTIATNMAGRGTDIQLGGNLDMRIADEAADIEDAAKRQAKAAEIEAEIEVFRNQVLAAGGLYVIGTERHESRRIDNQLRGRSGRQGDPGESKFFLSLEDDLMRIFGSERMDGVLQKLGLEKGEAIVHSWINKALEKAQQKVETRNYDIRKNLLKFDDVMNDQRKVIYEQRIELMEAEDVADTISDMRRETVDQLVEQHIPANAYPEQWDADGLSTSYAGIFGNELPLVEWAAEEGIADEEIRERLYKESDRRMAEKAAKYGREVLRMVEKSLLLQILDQSWKEHLQHLDFLRQGIGLRAYAQKDPLNEYKREAFVMFEHMLDNMRETVTGVLANLELQVEEPPEMQFAQQQQDMIELHTDPLTGENEMAEAGVNAMNGGGPRRAGGELDPDDPASWGKVPRNRTCPCGSGRKFKHCHGSA